MKRVAMSAGVIGLAALVGVDAGAVTTKSWNVDSYKDFDEGDGEHVLVSSLGEVGPGRATDRVAIETDAIWTAVRGDDGTVYAATLDKGQILAIAGGKSRVLASLEKETPWIGALLLAGGTLYVGTVASGSVHAVDVKTGKATLVAKLDGVDHVWALATSADGKTLYAATGAEGKLFAIDVASRKASVAWDADETHLLSLIRARDGALWLGTADEAILYRFDPKSGQARAVADFAGSEIKALVEQDGMIVAAVNDFDAKSGTAPKKPQPKGTAGKSPDPGTPGSEKLAGADAQPRPGERKGKGTLFRVEADGRVEQLHAVADGYFQALAAGEGGSVYAAAGSGGRVYQVQADRTVSTAFDVEERQVNALVAWTGGVAFATGDGAALYTASGASKTGSYTSKVLDAGFPARWGNLRFRGDGAFTVETRSGNTAKPDKGWSAWQKIGKSTRAGGDAQVGAVISPPGRYAQFRVSFTGAGLVRQVQLYYLPQNQRARVTDVTVDAGGGSGQVTMAGGAAKPRSPIVKVRWKVDNTDGDDLAYTLEMRPEGDTEWRPVPMGPAGEPYGKTDFEWNTEALPDGLYRLRVTASDARANPRDLALADHYISSPFLIDNQKPVVADLAVKYPTAAARAVDSFSRIDEIAYSVDGGEWLMAYPKDGVFDDVSEAFTIKLPDGLAAGPHTLSIRTADEADNIGAASVTFRVGQGK